MKNDCFLIIGGDNRQKYLYEALLRQGMAAEIIFHKPEPDPLAALRKIPEAEIIVLPIPVSADGVFLFAPESRQQISVEEIANRISEKAVVFAGGEHPAVTASAAKKTVNLLGDEVMTLKNAMATAEAALAVMIGHTDLTLFGAEILMIGYGRIGNILSEYLLSLHSHVTVCARKEQARTLAKLKGCRAVGFGALEQSLAQADIIVNTVPSPVLGKKELLCVNPRSLIVDLASKPGGVDFVTSEILGIKAIHALSLPGKYSPKSAAKFIEETIFNTLI